jgi:L1 cell adhesion molecule like protein
MGGSMDEDIPSTGGSGAGPKIEEVDWLKFSSNIFY